MWDGMMLKDWIAAQRYPDGRKMTVVAFSDQIGMDYSAVYRILRGKRGVSLEVALVIEYYTGGAVPAESFLERKPEDYIRQWRSEARKSVSASRRERAVRVRGHFRHADSAALQYGDEAIPA